jgi:multidrug efflux pump subunit AcrB
MKGAIAWMARNSVAANLLMLFIVLVGFVSVSTIVQEVFPEASLDAIQIRVPYPGASPEEVEESIVRRIEEQIEAVDGIRRISSVAAENVGVVTAQLRFGENVTRVLDDIKSEVDRITTFPVDAEEPEVAEVTTRRQAIQLAIHGEVPERSLKELAHRMKDDLTSRAGISYVAVAGTREYEISIEVSEAALSAYGLTIDAVTMAVRRGSMELPGGSIRAENEEILVRTEGRNYSGADFEQIVVRGLPDGTLLRLKDVATVRDGFEESDLITRFDGQPTALLQVYRTSDERVLDIVEEVYAYVETVPLPEGVSISVWQDEAKLLKSRYELMLKNGAAGLILVILALGLFMNSRLAFWVSAGIFISFLGTFAVMLMLGASINLISLVAFILALGIVVDDAIVVGENVFAEQEKGRDPADAAVVGSIRLARPVVFAVLTTMAAFSPLLFVPGIIGKFMQQLPLVIITVLGISLIESLFILPAHLAHVKALRGGKKNVVAAGLERVQDRVAAFLQWNIEGPLTTTLEWVSRHYNYVILAGVSAILLSVGLVASGLVRFSFFPDIEGENVIARIEMPEGTPADRTEAIAARLEEAGYRVAAEIQADLPEDHPPFVKHVFSIVGRLPSITNAPNQGGGNGLIDPTQAEVNFELLESEFRDISALTFQERWREAVGDIPEARSLQFQSSIFTLGSAIQLEVASADPDRLDQAVEQIKQEIASFSGTYEIEDDRRPGKRELKLSLKPAAQTMGVTLDDLARQVRGAYYGNEALRVQRGRDEIRVMVRLPESERDALADLADFHIRTPAGARIPLAEVADLSMGTGSSAINRRDRSRVVTITAEVNEDIVPAGDVIAALETEVLPRLMSELPGLRASFEGEQREQADAVAAIRRGFIIAIFLIFALLAIPFRSYTQPLIIMTAIPFGVIGAILGHLIMGLPVGILSLFGIVGLAGVVVNDSLVLIDYVNQEREKGLSVHDAVIEAARVRFRPILLTSLTTFLGVLPLILERSLQAQFLIPIAASLGFGILFSTFIILVLVPALVILEDIVRRRVLGWMGRGEGPTNVASASGSSPMTESEC